MCFSTDGYVVCEEFEEILQAAWVEEQEIQKQKEKEVCMDLYLLRCDYQNTQFTSKMRTFWQVLTYSKGLLRVKIEVRTGFQLGLG